MFLKPWELSKATVKGFQSLGRVALLEIAIALSREPRVFLEQALLSPNQGSDRRSPCTGPNDAVTRRWDHGTAAVQELGPETPPRACPEEGLAYVGARKKKRRMKMWIWPRYWPISSAGNLPSDVSPPGTTTVPWSQLQAGRLQRLGNGISSDQLVCLNFPSGHSWHSAQNPIRVVLN